MNLNIRHAGGEALVFTAAAEEALLPYCIPGSKIFTAKGSFGILLLQEIEFDGYSFLFSIIDIQDDSRFIVSSSETLLLTHTILQGRWACEIKHTGKFKLREGNFCLFSDRYLQAGFYFKKGYVYKAITINYPTSIFRQGLQYYPALQHYGNAILRGEPFNAGSTKPLQSNKALHYIHTLLHAPFSITIKSFHTRILNKLLFLLLRQLSHENKERKTVSYTQLDKIYAAKALIDARLPHHIPITLLAKKAGLNEHDLQKGFKAVTGKSLFGYFREQVLLAARRQLEETNEPIKAIALKAGYKNQSNFSMAFKKFFGIAPGEVRKV